MDTDRIIKQGNVGFMFFVSSLTTFECLLCQQLVRHLMSVGDAWFPPVWLRYRCDTVCDKGSKMQ